MSYHSALHIKAAHYTNWNITGCSQTYYACDHWNGHTHKLKRTPIYDKKKENVELRITKALLCSSNFSLKKGGVNWHSSQTILKRFPHHAKCHSCCCTVAITQHQWTGAVSRSAMMGNRVYSTGIIILCSSKVAICIGFISTGTSETNRLRYIKPWAITRTNYILPPFLYVWCLDRMISLF
jgi:hypothetical protein